jgi:hypothetical protein
MGARKGLPNIADAVPQAGHPDGPLHDNRCRRRIDRPAGAMAGSGTEPFESGLSHGPFASQVGIVAGER